MKNRIKFLKKQTGPNLVPELYDGYDYEYSIVQNFRNTKGILDANSLLQASVVKIIRKQPSGEEAQYKFVVIAKVLDMDETFDDPAFQTEYNNLNDLILIDKFLPDSIYAEEPEVGDLIYVQYTDPHNRIGGTYKGKIKMSSVQNITNKEDPNLPQPPKDSFDNNASTLSSVGNCKYANEKTKQVDYSNCKTSYPEGEFEIFFGNKTSYGKVRMVYADFNSKPNILVQQVAYNSLRQMFEDAQQAGVELKINSGFRSYETQECFYNNFLACYQEWSRSGQNGTPPSAAADPKLSRPSTSSHLNGLAVDFNTGVSRTDPNLKDVFANSRTNTAGALEMAKNKLQDNSINSKAWKWLLFNSEKYGWVWSGIKFREPWHFHFDIEKATRNGFV